MSLPYCTIPLNVEHDLKSKQIDKIINDLNLRNQELMQDKIMNQKLYDELNVNYSDLLLEYTKTKQQTAQLNENVTMCEDELTIVKSELEEAKREIIRLNKVIAVIEIDLNSVEEGEDDKNIKIATLTKEVSELQGQLMDSNLKIKKLVDEAKSKQNWLNHYEKERNEIINKYNAYSMNIEIRQKEKVEEKEWEFAQRIDEYKRELSRIENENKNEKERNNVLKDQYTKMYKDMQGNIKQVAIEWESKYKESQINYENIIKSIENKYWNELSKIKKEKELWVNDWTKELSKYKKDWSDFKNIQNEYIHIKQHEIIVEKRTKEIKELYDKEMNIKQENANKEYDEKIMKWSEEKNKEYNFIISNLESSIKSKDEGILEWQNKNDDLIKAMEKDEREINTLKNAVDEKERWINEVKNNYDKLLIEVNKVSNELELCQTERAKLNETKAELLNDVKMLNELKVKYVEIETENNELIKENKSLNESVNAQSEAIKNYENKWTQLIKNSTENELKIAEWINDNHNWMGIINDLESTFQSKTEILTNVMKEKTSNLKSQWSSIKKFINNEQLKNKTFLHNHIQEFHTFASRNESKHNEEIAKLRVEKKTWINQISQLKSANDVLINKENELLKTKDWSEAKKNDKINSLQQTLHALSSYITNLKNAYTKDINHLKSDIDEYNRNVSEDIAMKETMYNTRISNWTAQINKYNNENSKLKIDFEGKSRGLSEFQENFLKWKDVYENKIQILSNKLQASEEAVNSGCNTINWKTEQINHLNTLIVEWKNQVKAIKNQLSLRNEETMNFKNECERWLLNKDKKISQWQSIVNQSLHSFNSGANNIEIAKQLDNEVRELIQSEKNKWTFNYNSNSNDEDAS